jgi:hypothetical protein
MAFAMVVCSTCQYPGTIVQFGGFDLFPQKEPASGETYISY